MVTQDLAEAAKWYRKLAEQGFAPAQFKVGWMYQVGKGVDQDRDEAVRWYRKAVENGNLEARHKLDFLKNKVADA